MESSQESVHIQEQQRIQFENDRNHFSDGFTQDIWQRIHSVNRWMATTAIWARRPLQKRENDSIQASSIEWSEDLYRHLERDWKHSQIRWIRLAQKDRIVQRINQWTGDHANLKWRRSNVPHGDSRGQIDQGDQKAEHSQIDGRLAMLFTRHNCNNIALRFRSIHLATVTSNETFTQISSRSTRASVDKGHQNWCKHRGIHLECEIIRQNMLKQQNFSSARPRTNNNQRSPVISDMYIHCFTMWIVSLRSNGDLCGWFGVWYLEFVCKESINSSINQILSTRCVIWSGYWSEIFVFARNIAWTEMTPQIVTWITEIESQILRWWRQSEVRLPILERQTSGVGCFTSQRR
jgi:hypothetical protein